MNTKANIYIGLIILLVASGTVPFLHNGGQTKNEDNQSSVNKSTKKYNPQINPKDFSTNITNNYFTLPVGKKMTYEAITQEGPRKNRD